MATLHIEHPAGNNNRVPLTEGTLVFGRSPDCDLVLDADGISRRHGRFARDGSGHWWIDDLGSKNGILLNGRHVKRRRLSEGDTLLVGTLKITFVSEAPIPTATRHTLVTISPQIDAGSSSVDREAGDLVSVDGRRLKALYDLSTRLLGQYNVAGLVEATSAALLGTLDAARVVFGLTCDPERDHDQLIVRGETGPPTEITLSRSVLRRTLDARRAILIGDTGSDIDLSGAQSIISGGIGSALCVPIARKENTIGFIYVDNRGRRKPLTEADLEFAGAIGALMGAAIETARLQEAELVKQRMEAELVAARRVQQAIMPSTWPATDDWDIHGYHEPCREVGGDYYDAIMTGTGRLWLITADVSGKGASAALLASSIHTAVQALINEIASPAKLLTRLNQILLRRQVESAFVTCAAVMIDPDAENGLIASAGHPSPVMLSGQAAPASHQLEPGFMLGVFPEAEFVDQPLPLAGPGDSLLLYTDGVTEALDPQGMLFGEDGLLACAQTVRNRPAADLVDAVRQAVNHHRGTREQSDDITILACRRKPR